MGEENREEARGVDRLIRDLIAHLTPVTERHVERITRYISTAPFNTKPQIVPRRERGSTHQGVVLGSRADALTLHLIRRVVTDAQWANGMSAADYVTSLHRVALDPDATVVLYRQWGRRHIVALLTATGNVVAPEHLGPRALPNVVVLYSADDGCIISGYQFSELGALDIPADALWIT